MCQAHSIWTHCLPAESRWLPVQTSALTSWLCCERIVVWTQCRSLFVPSPPVLSNCFRFFDFLMSRNSNCTTDGSTPLANTLRSSALRHKHKTSARLQVNTCTQSWRQLCIKCKTKINVVLETQGVVNDWCSRRVIWGENVNVQWKREHLCRNPPLTEIERKP